MVVAPHGYVKNNGVSLILCVDHTRRAVVELTVYAIESVDDHDILKQDVRPLKLYGGALPKSGPLR